MRQLFTQTAVPLIDRRDNEFRQRRPTVYQVPVVDGFRQLIMVALWNRADHYIFALWFLLSSIFFISSPNLSRRRLDVCHISTHGVALVRI